MKRVSGRRRFWVSALVIATGSWLSASGCVLEAPPPKPADNGATPAGGEAGDSSIASPPSGTTGGGGRNSNGASGSGNTDTHGGAESGAGGDDASAGSDSGGGTTGGSSHGGATMGGSSHGGATMGGTSTAGGSPVADLTCRPRPATSCTKPTVNQWSNWAVADRGHQYTTTADTATDAVTGLTWQRQVATLSGSSCEGPALFTWPEASCYCDSLTLPGATSGWRLPSRSELSSLIEFGADPTINANVFPGSMAEIYWTSSGNDQKQWEVNFAAPSVNAVPDPTGAHFVRCVRGGTAAPAARYSAGTGTLAGTVLDNATKLRWQKVQLGPGDAASLGQQCAASTLGQLTWRLPSISELLTTIDESVESPALDTNFFAGSADAKVTSATSEREGYFDGVTYGWGQSIALSASSTDVYARCVSN